MRNDKRGFSPHNRCFYFVAVHQETEDINEMGILFETHQDSPLVHACRDDKANTVTVRVLIGLALFLCPDQGVAGIKALLLPLNSQSSDNPYNFCVNGVCIVS